MSEVDDILELLSGMDAEQGRLFLQSLADQARERKQQEASQQQQNAERKTSQDAGRLDELQSRVAKLSSKHTLSPAEQDELRKANAEAGSLLREMTKPAPPAPRFNDDQVRRRDELTVELNQAMQSPTQNIDRIRTIKKELAGLL